jgi:hypothetical protein
MATFSELIPGCKTSPHRSIRWTPTCGCSDLPCDGILEIHDCKRVRKYFVTEFLPDCGFPGRAFRFDKADGTEFYNCLINQNGQDHICDCAAGIYGRVRECCHVASVWAVIGNGWLDDPRNDPRLAKSLSLEEAPF